MSRSRCDRCGETVDDIDAGFSPGLHAMRHDCGGTWRVVASDPDVLDGWQAIGRLGAGDVSVFFHANAPVKVSIYETESEPVDQRQLAELLKGWGCCVLGSDSWTDAEGDGESIAPLAVLG